MLLARSRGEGLSDLRESMITEQCVFVEILSAVPHILERGRENSNMLNDVAFDCNFFFLCRGLVNIYFLKLICLRRVMSICSKVCLVSCVERFITCICICDPLFLWTSYFVVLFQDYFAIPNPKALLLSYKLTNCMSASD